MDPSSLARRLTAVGVPPEQADVHAQIIAEVMARMVSKADMEAGFARINERLDAIVQDLANLYIEQAKLRAEQVILRAEFRESYANLRSELLAELARQKTALVQWMVSLFIAQVGVTAALIRFMPH